MIKPPNEPFVRSAMIDHRANKFFNVMREQLKLKK